jgi:hypothetical protein
VLRQQRQQEYYQRPEVQKHQEYLRQQKSQGKPGRGEEEHRK